MPASASETTTLPRQLGGTAETTERKRRARRTGPDPPGPHGLRGCVATVSAAPACSAPCHRCQYKSGSAGACGPRPPGSGAGAQAEPGAPFGPGASGATGPGCRCPRQGIYLPECPVSMNGRSLRRGSSDENSAEAKLGCAFSLTRFDRCYGRAASPAVGGLWLQSSGWLARMLRNPSRRKRWPENRPDCVGRPLWAVGVAVNPGPAAVPQPP